MSLTPAWTTVCRVLTEVEPGAVPSGDLPYVDTASTIVRVNGLEVPVVRVSWKKVGEFFERLYEVSNRENFSAGLPPCKLLWNKRFRRVGGRIDCKHRTVELSAAHYESCGCAALGIVLIHEQIHLSLYEEGIAYGHTPEFKRRSLGLGLPAIHHEMPLPDRLRKPVRYHLYCCACGAVVKSRVKFRKPRACAACCNRFAAGHYDTRFRLTYMGIQHCDASEVR